MPFLELLSAEDRQIAESYFQPMKFLCKACIIEEGQPGNGCYLIDEGEVRLELGHGETDSENVLGYLTAGSFLGEFSLVDGQPRSLNAYAHSDVRARWLGRAEFDELGRAHPSIALEMTRALAADLTVKLRSMNARLSEYLVTGDTDDSTREMVARALEAHRAFVSWPEERVDALIQDIAQAIADRAGELAQVTVDETGMGNVPDKTEKNIFASVAVAQSLVGRPAAGVVAEDITGKILEIASPVGVVLGLIPLTNPVATLVFKTLICLKGRNALILSCHRQALGVGNQTGRLIQDALRFHGAPVDLVQWIKGRSSRRATGLFMRHPDVALILATGGPSMVHAAYSSGKPAIGVGPGNAPCWITADADLDAAAACVVRSKSFDNGVICGSENNLVVDSSVKADFEKALEANGTAVLSSDERNQVHASFFEQGHLARVFLGRPASEIAAAIGVRRPYEIKLIVAPVGRQEISGPYALEKLAPLLSLFVARDETDGIELCKAILARSGQGHTAIIHTRSEALARRFGQELIASRLLVNSPGAQGCIGLTTGLVPSMTLGCGTFGGNSTTDNVTYRHLLNIKRLAHAL